MYRHVCNATELVMLIHPEYRLFVRTVVQRIEVSAFIGIERSSYLRASACAIAIQRLATG